MRQEWGRERERERERERIKLGPGSEAVIPLSMAM